MENLESQENINFPFKLTDSGKINNFLPVYKLLIEKKGRKIKFCVDSQAAIEKNQDANEKGGALSILKKNKSEKNQIQPNFGDFSMEYMKNAVDQSRKNSYEFYKGNLSLSLSDSSDNNNDNEIFKKPFGLTREETTKSFIKVKEIKYLLVTEMNDIEKVVVDFKNFSDKYPCKKQLKYIILYFR